MNAKGRQEFLATELPLFYATDNVSIATHALSLPPEGQPRFLREESVMGKEANEVLGAEELGFYLRTISQDLSFMLSLDFVPFYDHFINNEAF